MPSGLIAERAGYRRAAAGHVLAPDGSEVRSLLDLRRGGLGHCTLSPKAVSQAVRHQTIEEIWYFIKGTRPGLAETGGS